MAKTKKRADGLYQKQIIIGRNSDGSYKRKSVYAKTLKELDEKLANIKHQIQIGIRIEDDSTFLQIANVWLDIISACLADSLRSRLRRPSFPRPPGPSPPLRDGRRGSCASVRRSHDADAFGRTGPTRPPVRGRCTILSARHVRGCLQEVGL